MLSMEQLTCIADKYKTPTYVFDIEELTKRAQSIRKIAGEDIGLCFAMKANPFLVHYMKPLVDRFEVCSPGEFAICGREKLNMHSVVLSGVFKSKDDVEHAMQSEVGVYTVESAGQWETLSGCANQAQKKISALLRLTSGNQFGLDAADIERIVQSRADHPNIEIRGIQFFSGTQKKNMEQAAKEIEEVGRFCNHLEEKYGYHAEEVEYGPGLPIAYFAEDADNQDFSKLEQLTDLLKHIRKKHKVTLEIGRYFTATCGMYLSKIVDIKVNKGCGYCIIDGGIHHVNYYGQVLALKFPKVNVVKNENGHYRPDIKEWTICGSLCTTGDILMKKYPMDNPNIGDLIVFYNIGAYSITETSYLFLSREMPLVLAGLSNEASGVGIEILRQRVKTDRFNSRQQMGERGKHEIR